MNLLPANIEAWELYNRVWEQIGSFPIGDGKQFHTYLRAEAVEAIINLAKPDDPLGTFDKVMLIHRVKHKSSL